MSRFQVPCRNVAVIVLLLPVVLVLALVIKNLVFLLSEFVFVSNGATELEPCSEVDFHQHIPLIMHQVYGFKDRDMKTNHKNKRDIWKNTHKNYTHHLWNETAVDSLIQREYAELYGLYKSYRSWIQRADVSRYVVLYHYGGWYVDIDIGCNKGIHEIAEEAYRLRKHVVLRHTIPVGTSNDIFGITPRHPFLKSVLDNLYKANRWYIIPHWNILFSAGSTYMWGRYLNYPCKNDVIILDEDRYSKYFQVDHDGSWHSWDTGTINVLFTAIRNHVFMFGLLIILIILGYMFCRFLFFTRLNNR